MWICNVENVFLCSQYAPKPSSISQQTAARASSGSNIRHGDAASSHHGANKVLISMTVAPELSTGIRYTTTVSLLLSVLQY